MRISIIYNILRNNSFKNGILFSVFSFLNKGISFVLLVILANYIAPSDYGKLSLYSTFIMFLGYFISLSTPGYLSQSFFQRDKEDFKIDVSIVIIITLISLITILAIFFPLNKYITNLLDLEFDIVLIGIFTVFFSIFFQIHLNLYRLDEKINKYGIYSCGFAVLNFILTIILVIIVNFGWKGKIYASLVTYITFFVLAILYLYKNRLASKDCLKAHRYKEILFWSIPLIPHLATTWIKQGCDRYIINSTHSLEDVGLFSFGLNIANIILMIGTAFNNTNSVNIYKTLSNDLIVDKKKALKATNRKINLIYMGSTIIIIISGIIGIPLFFPMYRDSIGYFVIISISMYIQCLYFLYCNYLFYYKRTQKLMLITFSTSILHLSLSLVLTKYSLIYTSLIYVVSQVTMVYCVRKQSIKLIKNIK